MIPGLILGLDIDLSPIKLIYDLHYTACCISILIKSLSSANDTTQSMCMMVHCANVICRVL